MISIPEVSDSSNYQKSKKWEIEKERERERERKKERKLALGDSFRTFRESAKTKRRVSQGSR